LRGLLLFLVERARKGGLEDEQLFLRDSIEDRGLHVEVFGEDFLGRMCQPVRDQKRVEFIEVAVVEYQEKATTVGAKALNGMRNSRRKEPQIALRDILNEALRVLVHGSDARIAFQHDGPFGFHMPMQLANSAGCGSQFDGGKAGGDRELARAHLAGPAAA